MLRDQLPIRRCHRQNHPNVTDPAAPRRTHRTDLAYRNFSERWTKGHIPCSQHTWHGNSRLTACILVAYTAGRLRLLLA